MNGPKFAPQLTPWWNDPTVVLAVRLPVSVPVLAGICAALAPGDADSGIRLRSADGWQLFVRELRSEAAAIARQMDREDERSAS